MEKYVFASLLTGFGKSLDYTAAHCSTTPGCEVHLTLPPLARNGRPWAVATWFNWRWKTWLVRFERNEKKLSPIMLKVFLESTFSGLFTGWAHELQQLWERFRLKYQVNVIYPIFTFCSSTSSCMSSEKWLVYKCTLGHCVCRYLCFVLKWQN